MIDARIDVSGSKRVSRIAVMLDNTDGSTKFFSSWSRPSLPSCQLLFTLPPYYSSTMDPFGNRQNVQGALLNQSQCLRIAGSGKQRLQIRARSIRTMSNLALVVARRGR